MRRTPWSRIREQNSVYKELLEIVGNGKPTGQCVKGDNCIFRHDINKRGKSYTSRIRLRILSCSRMSEKHREPEVPECTESQWENVIDGHARITLRGTCNNSFCETWNPPECLFYKSKSGCRFDDKCAFAHRQVDAQPTKWSKSNNDKSAVALLNNGKLARERESVSDSCHDRTGKLVRKSGKKLGQISSRSQFSDARQLGSVFQDMTPAEVYSPEGHRHAENDPACKVQEGYLRVKLKTETKFLRSDIFAQVNLMGAADAPKFEDRSLEQTEWQELGAREAAWKLAKSVFKLKEHERFRNGCKNSGKIW